MKILLILYCFITILIAACIPPRRLETKVNATIPVAGERISLSPPISEARLEDLPGWPTDPEQQKILLKTFDEIWERLQSEFRRCQKYGLYTMVDDNENPSIRISVIFTAVQFSNDTLSMPVRLQAERLRDDQRFIYTLPAIAVIPSGKKPSLPFHYYGQLLSDYRRRFPAALMVSFFYRHSVR